MKKQAIEMGVVLFYPLGSSVSYKSRSVSFCAFKEEGCLSIKIGMNKVIFTPT